MRQAQKGFGGTLRRLSLLPRRYGISSFKVRTRLREMIELLQRLEVTPTIPITAQTLERHPELRSELGTVDPAVHGYRHVAYARMSPSEQGRDLEAARRIFANHGLATRGFRAPYLAANETTRELLRGAGFLYDSSRPTFVLPNGDSLFARAHKVAARRYSLVPRVPATITVDDGLVQIPVALPDDEILVDGLGVTNPETIARILDRMLDATCTHGSLLVLQVHPERFRMFADGIEHVAKRARDLGAWQAPLSEIAEHTVRNGGGEGLPFVLAVTGDLDAATLGDFASRLWGRF